MVEGNYILVGPLQPVFGQGRAELVEGDYIIRAECV